MNPWLVFCGSWLALSLFCTGIFVVMAIRAPRGKENRKGFHYIGKDGKVIHDRQ